MRKGRGEEMQGAGPGVNGVLMDLGLGAACRKAEFCSLARPLAQEVLALWLR